MKDKVLITGSSGFIGLHLNDLLKSKSELFVLKVSRRKLQEERQMKRGRQENNNYIIS